MSGKTILASLLAAVWIAGCGGGDDITSPGGGVCTENLAGNHGWVIRGGCIGSTINTLTGAGSAQFNAGTCELTLDVTPAAEKANGAKWMLNANLRSGNANVVRTGGNCPATDTGSVRVEGVAIIADVRTPSSSGCACLLNYTVNVSRTPS